MKNFLREYFTFTNRERRGILVLSVIIILLFFWLYFYDSFIKTPRVDFTSFEKEVEKYNASTTKDSSPEVAANTNYEFETPEKTKPELFKFNPNNLPIAEWEKLGLNKKLIHTIKNYEAKGGKFKTKNDLKKIYGFTDGIYNSLQPFILLPDSLPAFSRTVIGSALSSFGGGIKGGGVIGLNSADSLQLLSLPGIGPSFTKQIIKYREILGGFYNTEQLFEIYGFQKETYDKIQHQIQADEQLIKKININTCDVNILKSHPYIKYHLANLIINYRQQHGNYNTLEDLKKIAVMNDSIYRKIIPYITLQ